MFKALVAHIALWHRRARTRRQLQDLPNYMLADIGLDATMRDDECAKWGWQGVESQTKENGRCLRAPVSNFVLQK